MNDAQEAFLLEDAEGLCELMSDKAKRVAGYAAHAKPRACAQDVRPFFKWIRPGDEGDRLRVIDVDRRGDRASARLRDPSGATVDVPLVREGGRWKLDGLFNAGLSRIQVRTEPFANRFTAVAVAPPAIEAAPSVAVLDGERSSPARCTAPRAHRFPAIAGGCVISAEGEMDLSVLSPFGEMRFGRCGVAYTVHVGGDGFGWMTDMSITGGSPCFDALPCMDKQHEKIPWRLRMEGARDGAARLVVDDVCLDTCVGRFEGDWETVLERRGREWRVRADQAAIGSSGWRFYGTFLTSGSLTVRQLG